MRSALIFIEIIFVKQVSLVFSIDVAVVGEGEMNIIFPFYLFANDMTYANDVNMNVHWQSS